MIRSLGYKSFLVAMIFVIGGASVQAYFYEDFLRATPHKSMQELKDTFFANAKEFARPPEDNVVGEREKNKPKAFIEKEQFIDCLAAFVERQSLSLNNHDLWLRGDMPAINLPGESAAGPIFAAASLMSPFVQKKVVASDQKGYFIGDLHGSLHALLRILSYLRMRGVVNDTFELQGNHFLVFTGDYIDRGHYSIEVLYMVLRLKLANWNSVFLIKGNHEDQEIKATKGFGLELVINYGTETAKVIIDQYMKKVFSYFLCALFLGCADGDSYSFVQCCHGGIEYDYDHNFLLTASGDINYEKLAKKDGLVKALFSQDNGPVNGGKKVWIEKEKSFMSDIATVDAYLGSHPKIKAFIRGHQDQHFGLKMFFTQKQWNGLSEERRIGLGNGPFNWREVVEPDDQGDRTGFIMSNYSPIFTISSATEGREVPYDSYCSITFGHLFTDWRLRFIEVPLPAERHGMLVEPVVSIKTDHDYRVAAPL